MTSQIVSHLLLLCSLLSLRVGARFSLHFHQVHSEKLFIFKARFLTRSCQTNGPFTHAIGPEKFSSLSVNVLHAFKTIIEGGAFELDFGPLLMATSPRAKLTDNMRYLEFCVYRRSITGTEQDEKSDERRQ